MKLNLACGQMPLPGHINMDLEVKKGTNVCGDLRALPFKSSCAYEVKMLHCIEHVTFRQARNLLKDVHRILKEGGKVVVEAPDMMKAFATYKNPYILARHLYGSYEEIEKGNMLYAHHWGWTGKMCAQELMKAGFKNIRWTAGESHGRPERDFRVEATK